MRLRQGCNSSTKYLITVLSCCSIVQLSEGATVARRLQTKKCHYTLVFREMDMSECPSTGLYSKDKVNVIAPMHKDEEASPTPVGVPATDTTVIRDLKHRLDTLETKLFEEKVLNRELKTNMILQEQKLMDMTNALGGHTYNTSMIETTVRGFEISMAKQDNVMKSMEDKLAGLLLDVDEVYRRLENQDSKDATKLEDKVIPVESLNTVSNCNIPSNVSIFRDCEQVYNRGHTKSGVYYITSLYTPCPVPVFCDNETPPGGWLVILRRSDGSLSFDHSWNEYRAGFGDVTKEFWLGNANLFLLTNQYHYQLRIDMWDFYGSRVYAQYLHFHVEGERDRYRLHISNHSGTAPDGLASHNGMHFSTPDRDNDAYSEYHCAKEWGAGWWFSNCWFVILTGQYYNTTTVQYKGIAWNDWKNEQLKHVEMKMRPSGY